MSNKSSITYKIREKVTIHGIPDVPHMCTEPHTRILVLLKT